MASEAVPLNVSRLDRLQRGWLPALLTAVLVTTPAASVQAAGWSEHLEPVPFLALGGLLCAFVLGSARANWILTHTLAIVTGLSITLFQYSWFLISTDVLERMYTLTRRVAAWLHAAASGAPSTDNLLFAFTMGLMAWGIGYTGGIGMMRSLSPWWAIVPSGIALLLNLSYSPPELLPFLFIHLIAGIALLITATSLMRSERWQAEALVETLHPHAGYAIAGVGVGLLIMFTAWRIPAGEVHRGVASTWENVSGPWQVLQVNFDRLFAALNPSSLPGKGLSVAQTMAPRGSFELGNNPVLRISGREPGYWRAVTYDQYTGRAMMSSPTTSQRLDRREPVEGTMEPDAARKFSEYTVTLLAPSTSVIYAPDEPLTISVPTIYDYRVNRSDYGSLRPVAPIHEQQRYSVLASVSTASSAELRQAGTGYPAWSQNYLQLPNELPDRVRRESRRIIGDATNPYDAAIAIQQQLRGLTYSTRVPVPPAGRDWVSFLLFESKEGYCDYFAAAMTVMLRSVGIPSRVASGYVTGDWDASTQSYIATEHHAHSWTEVYFPGYGWITFEPSANRPAPIRPETAPIFNFQDDFLGSGGIDSSFDDLFPEDEDFNSSPFTPLPPMRNTQNNGILLIALGMLVLILLGGSTAGLFLWKRGIGRLPLVARPYAQLVRLATWCGVGPRPYQTPYEYSTELRRVVPSARAHIDAITEAYVAGIYGAKNPGAPASERLAALGSETRRAMLRTLALGRWREWFATRLTDLVGSTGRRTP